MPTCCICLSETSGTADWHAACASALFGTTSLPRLDVDLKLLVQKTWEMVGKMSFPGVQRKASVALSPDRKRIEFSPTQGRYILKPPIEGFPEIPANEHLTMQLAALLEIDVPPNGLLQLTDGNHAFIVRRFDRPEDGTKLPQEDFCQLASLPASKKYGHSAEMCVGLLRRHATEPPIAILAFFRLLLFSWCVGNGDLHLKNLSLLTMPGGIRRLSPAYDLVNTRLVIRGDPMALSISRKSNNPRRKDWITFGEFCGLPQRIVEQTLDRQLAAIDDMVELTGRSFLSPGRVGKYQKIIKSAAAILRP